MLKLNLYHRDDPECPNDWEGGWKLVSFNPGHLNSDDYSNYILGNNEFGEVRPANIGIQRKLQVGTAFILSYHEHGSCIWSLEGSGPQCAWDTAQFAGILIWTDDSWRPEMGKREEDARNFLKCYTDWANGSVYDYSIEDEDGEELSEGGSEWYGHDLELMFKEIRSYTKGHEVEVSGGAKDLADYHDVSEAA